MSLQESALDVGQSIALLAIAGTAFYSHSRGSAWRASRRTRSIRMTNSLYYFGGWHTVDAPAP